MKPFSKIRKTIEPWIEQFQLALDLSDPKNRARVQKMSGEKLGYLALKLRLYGLMAEVTGINDPEKYQDILRAKLPSAAADRLNELRKQYASVVKKLQAIKF